MKAGASRESRLENRADLPRLISRGSQGTSARRESRITKSKKEKTPGKAATYIDAARYILGHLDGALRNFNGKKSTSFVKRLLSAKRIFIYGSGRSGLVGRAFAIRLLHLGLIVYVIGESITPSIRKGDVVVVISRTGETYPVLVTAQIARNMGIEIICIVENEKSSIAKLSDLIIALPLKSDSERSKYAPLGTLFEIAAQIYLDGIIAELMARLNQTENDMRERHAVL